MSDDTPTRADLIERLRETKPRYCQNTGKHSHDVFCNRDGIEAAAALTADAERIAALEGEVERLREREAELHGQLMRMIDRWEDQRAALKGTDYDPA